MTISKLSKPVEILLVEDNFGDVLLTREAFENQAPEIQLSVASDGEEALAVLRESAGGGRGRKPDLVLLDLNLPRMDGRELLAILKSDPATQRIPIIILTSSKADIDILKSYDLKANSYIVKPVEFEKLEEAVLSLEMFWNNVATLPSAVEASDDGQ